MNRGHQTLQAAVNPFASLLFSECKYSLLVRQEFVSYLRADWEAAHPKPFKGTSRVPPNVSASIVALI
uniref:Uncharacterized protein n=1 Tax=Utricularia reniformis TaxID=192314 RepID=A0A1Y0B3L3_9LAMI|nr:hypothetical protein AEK19_MT1795 [Utricularia reniformis]ART31967.1 hypothetical protein AEK19_MT1795 [Utricularia reniformis]